MVLIVLLLKDGYMTRAILIPLVAIDIYEGSTLLIGNYSANKFARIYLMQVMEMVSMRGKYQHLLR